MPFERILPAQWMHISKELREHLAKVFNVQTSGITEIFNEELRSDGRTYDDLAVITKAKMEEYIGSEETFLRAWEITVAKAYSELHPPVATIQPIVAKTVEEIPSVVAEPAPAALSQSPVEDLVPTPAPVVTTTADVMPPSPNAKKEARK